MNQNDDINRQVDSAKSDIKNKKDTQSQIDKLQNQIDQLKQNEENLITKIKVKLLTLL
jgi:hypothetical protein